MKPWTGVVFLFVCLAIVAFARPYAHPSIANLNEDDFRRLEQTWLNAAAIPDLPALRNHLSDDFMGTSFAGGVLSKSDVVPPDGIQANHMPNCVLHDSTVRIFGDSAVLMGEVGMQAPHKSELVQMTTVFQKHRDDWQVIAIHMSKTHQ